VKALLQHDKVERNQKVSSKKSDAFKLEYIELQITVIEQLKPTLRNPGLV
jgi:hypothetical protein